MDTSVFRLRHDLEVVRMVVPFIPVFVVDNLTRQQFSSYFLLSDNSVHMPPLELHIVVTSP